jgi:branched-chain amino acid transport system ATP-binding protein
MSKCLEIKNISKTWPEIRALTDVNLSLDKQEIHAIIGPNGAGKSTFFGVISGEIEPTTGQVDFLGENVNRLPEWKRVRKGMARAFQVPKVFPSLTVEENILFSCRIHEHWKNKTGLKGLFKPSKHVVNKAYESLNDVGLYNQKDKKVSDISHGDKKRLEIAIAIALKPKLLLLDEPTAGMSPEDTTATVKLIKKIHDTYDLTILLTEHDMEVVFTLANRISVLNRGQLLVTDTPMKIRKNELVREIYLGKEAEEIVRGS